MLRQSAIRLSLEALAAARFPRWAPRVGNASGVVLTLHHVRPREASRFSPNAGLAVTPDFLDEMIRDLKGAGWRFVSVDEVLSAPAGTGCERRISITLDDGYRNNLEHAWPVFRSHGVPFAIYICPGFCDATAELWWEALELIIRDAAHVDLPDEPGAPSMPAGSLAEKRRAFTAWRYWLTTEVDEARQRRAIRRLAARYGLDLEELARDLVMSWDEVRSIAADPLCTIGAHTQTHRALARLGAPDALAEMRESAERIEAEIGRRPTTIAFPYGYPAAAGPREASLAAQAGFEASFTTRPGFLQAGADRHGLPRVSVNGFHQDPRLVNVLLTPGLWKLGSQIGFSS